MTITKFALASLAALSFPSWCSAAELFGVKRYCDEGASSGVYSIGFEAGSQPLCVYRSGDMMANVTSAFADGKMYVVSYLDFFGTATAWMQVYDAATGNADMSIGADGFKMLGALEVTDFSGCTAQDPTTGTVYAVCIDGTDTSRMTLSTMNLETAKMTPGPRLDTRLFAMAFDAGGSLYGIDGEGYLCTVNKYDGTVTPLGSTGILPVDDQTATIVFEENALYWSVYTESVAGLYKVDLATAAAIKVTDYELRYQFAGLGCIQEARTASAPGEPTGLEAEFAGASLTGTLTFTLPATDEGGASITGEAGYTVECNGKILAEGNGICGEEQNVTITAPGEGECRFEVSATHSSLRSKAAVISLWVGMDTPCAATDVCLEMDGNSNAMLTWKVPERGVHGGYVDPEALRTEIIRGPEVRIVARAQTGTEFTEHVERDGVYPLMYMVTPYIDDRRGESVISDHVLVGERYEAPFEIDFTDPFNLLTVEIEDANGDHCTWTYDDENGCTYCMWPIADTADDWLVTAPMHVTPDKDYTVEIEVRSEGKWNIDEEAYDDVYAGDLEVYAVRGARDKSEWLRIAGPEEVSSAKPEWIVGDTLKPEEEDDYRIAIRQNGSRSIYWTYLRSIRVTANDRSGIEVTTATETESTDAAEEFYNLQGMRIAGGATHSGPFIVRKGSKVSKRF